MTLAFAWWLQFLCCILSTCQAGPATHQSREPTTSYLSGCYCTSISIMMHQEAYHSRINYRVGCDRPKASFVRILYKFTSIFCDHFPMPIKTWLTCFVSHLYICKSIHSHYFPLWIHECRKVNLEDQCTCCSVLRDSEAIGSVPVVFGSLLLRLPHIQASGAEQRILFVVVRFPEFFPTVLKDLPTLAWWTLSSSF